MTETIHLLRGIHTYCGPSGSGYKTTPNVSETNCNKCKAYYNWQEMWKAGKGIMYFVTVRDNEYRINDWPNVVWTIPYMVRKGRHNLAGVRYDVWFWLGGLHWHGVQYGDNTQLLHCKATKP